MPRAVRFVALLLCVGLFAWAQHPSLACGPYGQIAPEDGQTAVDNLMATRSLILRNHQELLEDPEADLAEREFVLNQIAQIDARLDEVGHQYGCVTSGLYWHTDLADAQAAAVASGKPILSLRMLGNLTDEYSCANSRFFRTTLYANAEIAAKLREHFVLHWESVRPVPVVTIDFGDGRVLERTLTGNSAHYVLTPQGEPVDLLPGLYGPAAFSTWLDDAAALAGRASALPVEERSALLAEYHAQRLAALEEAFQADLNQILPLSEESHSLRSADRVDENTWRQIAAIHADLAELDDASLAAIEAQHPTAFNASFVAVTKRMVESPLVRMVRNLEDSIALDTVRNEYLLHAQIHTWFAEGSAPEHLIYFTERVYAELFLTPASDPWLGLAPPDTYTGLENGGLSIEGANPSALLLRSGSSLPVE